MFRNGNSKQTLYCFMVVHPREASLLRVHLDPGIGTLAACDAYDVFSNVTSFEPPIPGLGMTVAVQGSMDVPLVEPYMTAMNSEIFQAVWRQIFVEKRYQAYDWVIKLDADTMFWASSVRDRITALNIDSKDNVLLHTKIKWTPGGVYHGLDGPLIAISRGAADAYGADPSHCENEVDISGKSEDWYLDECLTLLGTKSVPEPGLLMSFVSDDVRACKNPKLPSAIHHFKEDWQLRKCYSLRESLERAKFGKVPWNRAGGSSQPRDPIVARAAHDFSVVEGLIVVALCVAVALFVIKRRKRR